MSAPDRVRGAAEYWDALLERGDRADEVVAALRQAGPNLIYKGRPLCDVLRPQFIAAEQYREQRHVITRIHSAMRRVFGLVRERPELGSVVGLTDEDRVFLEDQHCPPPAIPVTRFDGMMAEGTLRLVEYNAEPPIGLGCGEELARVFTQTRVWREFSTRHSAKPVSGKRLFVRAIRSIYRAWASQSGRNMEREPTVAFVDWPDAASRSEFEVLVSWLEANGVPAFITEPAALEYQDGRVFAGSRRVDFVYKRVIVNELLARFGIEGLRQHPMYRAALDGAVCLSNPFASKVLHKKAILAALHDSRCTPLFSSKAIASIRRHVPWTALLTDERASGPDGELVELLPFARSHRDELVLKPNDDYGGAAVVLGAECDDRDWDQAIKHALQTPTVVQTRVAQQPQAFPVFRGGLGYEPRFVDRCPWVFGDSDVAGQLVRVSTQPLMNLAQGGAMTPSFILEN